MKKLFLSVIGFIAAFCLNGIACFAAEETASEAAATLGDTSKIMGQGMLGIFIVMVLLYIVIIVLNRTTSDNN